MRERREEGREEGEAFQRVVRREREGGGRRGEERRERGEGRREGIDERDILCIYLDFCSASKTRSQTFWIAHQSPLLLAAKQENKK